MLLRRIAASLTAALALAACHLVDQRNFDAKAGAKPIPKTIAGPAARPAPALVTIRYTTPNPEYRESVAAAVHRALARKPDVLFTVTTLIPASVEADSAAADSGRDVAQAIVDSGAAPGQVEQAVRLDPNQTVKEVRVDVH